MDKTKLDLNKRTDRAWYCKACERRLKLPIGTIRCPECKGKLIRADHQIWRLIDTLRDELTSRDLEFRLVEQIPLETRSKLMYHLDCGIWLVGDQSEYSGVGVVIDLVPANPHGGYRTKRNLAMQLWDYGLHYRSVILRECSECNAAATACVIVDELVYRVEYSGNL